MSDHSHPDGPYRQTVPPSPFVGRERELNLLQTARSAVSYGNTQFVLLAGEPGIGKTRLIDEFVHSLDSTACRSFRAQCIDWQGSPAYWPWTQLLRDLLAYIGELAIRDLASEDADRIAMLLPEIGSGVHRSNRRRSPSVHGSSSSRRCVVYSPAPRRSIASFS